MCSDHQQHQCGHSFHPYFPPTHIKTDSNQHCISLPASVLQVLSKHRITQHEERLRLGSAYENNDCEFCATTRTPLQPRNVIGRHLKPILKRAGLPATFRWYDLRHTCASVLLHAGTNPKIVAEKLGNSSVNLTLNVYSHTIPSMQNDAAQTLEKALAEYFGTPLAHHKPKQKRAAI